MKKWIVCFCSAVLLLTATPLRPSEGRIPIFEPVVLTASGKYIVTRDILAPAGTRVIEVSGAGTRVFEIDLNGFTLRSDFIVIDANNVKSIVIRNGTISGTSTTSAVIRLSAAGPDGRVVVEDMKIAGGSDGILLSPVANFQIRRNFIVDSQDDGIDIANSALDSGGIIEDNVLRNVAKNNGAAAVLALNASTNGLVIRGNKIQADFSGIFVGTATGLLIEDNDVLATGGGAGLGVLSSDNCTVRNNRVSGTTALQPGIKLLNTTHCLVVDNVSINNAGHGISLEDGNDNRIERNIANNNSRSGVNLQASFPSGLGSFRNVIEKNVTNGNGLYGIFFDASSDDNRYGRNSSTGNLSNPVSCAAPGIATCGAPNLCDEGTANLSFGDNLIPGPPAC